MSRHPENQETPSSRYLIKLYHPIKLPARGLQLQYRHHIVLDRLSQRLVMFLSSIVPFRPRNTMLLLPLSPSAFLAIVGGGCGPADR